MGVFVGEHLPLRAIPSRWMNTCFNEQKRLQLLACDRAVDLAHVPNEAC